MKILHVSYSYIPGQFRGGVPKVVYALSRAQADLGHQVAVYTTNYNSSVIMDVPFGKPVWQDGVETSYFPVKSPRWFSSPALHQKLLTTAAQYDVIHSHNTFLALNTYAAEGRRAAGRPLFYHVHGALDPVVVNKGFVKRLRKLIYIRLVERQNFNQATGLFALSKVEIEQIRSYGITSPVHVIPNGVWLDDELKDSFREIAATRFREEFNLAANQKIILFLGRLVPKKGVHLLIRAFAMLRQSFPDTVLVIAGDRAQDPGYIRKLDSLVHESGIFEALIWAGFLDENRKKEAFAAATIFSHVSESEGMALAVLEAMAAGLPTIVSKECYLEDMVQAGAVVECEYQEESLTAALKQLLSSETNCRRTGQLAAKYVRQNHGWSGLARRVIQIYQDAIQISGAHVTESST